jgi:putative tricarboxylic transport membrane protein
VKRADIVSSLFWMAVGLGVSYAGYDLELGRLRDPGSGFLLFWIGVIMVGLSLITFIRALREEAGTHALKPFSLGVRWKKVISVVAALVIYAMVFSWLGFILSTVLLLIFLFKAVEPQRWSVAVAGAVVSALAAYTVFHLWLKSPLPQGLLGIG